MSRVSELREMPEEALRDKSKSLHQEAFNLRFQHATTQLDNTSRIRLVRREIARVNTIVTQNSKVQES